MSLNVAEQRANTFLAIRQNTFYEALSQHSIVFVISGYLKMGFELKPLFQNATESHRVWQAWTNCFWIMSVVVHSTVRKLRSRTTCEPIISFGDQKLQFRWQKLFTHFRNGKPKRMAHAHGTKIKCGISLFSLACTPFILPTVCAQSNAFLDIQTKFENNFFYTAQVAFSGSPVSICWSFKKQPTTYFVHVCVNKHIRHSE